jgi:hypothetical protein
VTDERTDKEAVEAVREIVRRAGHELRNALSGITVNLEVVGSRLGRDIPAKEVASFADRARLQASAATVLAQGILSLTTSVLAAVGEGTLKSFPYKASDGTVQTRTELLIHGPQAATFFTDIERLAKAVDVSVEQRGSRVILKVLPEGNSHSKD